MLENIAPLLSLVVMDLPELGCAHFNLLFKLVVINPLGSAQTYATISEELFGAVLSEDADTGHAASDLLLLLFVRMAESGQLLDNAEDIRASL